MNIYTFFYFNIARDVVSFFFSFFLFLIALITWNSNLVPLLEGLYISSPCTFELSGFWSCGYRMAEAFRARQENCEYPSAKVMVQRAAREARSAAAPWQSNIGMVKSHSLGHIPYWVQRAGISSQAVCTFLCDTQITRVDGSETRRLSGVSLGT